MPRPSEPNPPAFETAAAKMLAHLATAAPVPSDLVPELPDELDDVVARAMAKNPADRFPSALAFAEELRHWLEDEPLQIRPSRWWERLRRREQETPHGLHGLWRGRLP